MVDWSERAHRHAAQLPRELRKQHGVWFTPPALALPTARRALEPLLAAAPGAPLRVCDPAVGGGAFLLAAMQAANELGGEVALQLVGRDVDAAAAALAATALRDAGAAATDIAHGDGLLDDSLQPGTFDCVLTNPPWETLQASDDAPARSRGCGHASPTRAAASSTPTACSSSAATSCCATTGASAWWCRRACGSTATRGRCASCCSTRVAGNGCSASRTAAASSRSTRATASP
ncbi:MAG: N-6 DNA methylase [Planctomycetes bacterium]|nr:N-6 DNA methylase [Planctomycetota bacterium]